MQTYKQLEFLDWRNGKLPTASRGVVDADGVLYQSLQTLDLRTGEYSQIARGQISARGDVVTRVGKMPTPIRVLWDE